MLYCGNTTPYITIVSNTIQSNTAQFNTIQQYSTIQYAPNYKVIIEGAPFMEIAVLIVDRKHSHNARQYIGGGLNL